MRYDALVVGAGVNGLVAATELARGGRRVLVLEARREPGGLAAPREFHPGFVAPGVLHDQGLFRAFVAEELGLHHHGLRFRAAPPVLALEEEGQGLLLADAPETSAEELRRLAPGSFEAYRAYRAFLAAVAPFVRGMLDQPPPELTPESASGFLGLLARGVELKRLGDRHFLELLRVAPMCVADWMNECFPAPRLAAHLAAPALEATFTGPWSPGTAANLLLLECARDRHVEGGPPAVVRALVAALREAGGELRCEARVGELLCDGERVHGARLEDGTRLEAPLVLASCDPKQTFLDRIPPALLAPSLERSAQNVRARGTSAKLHLALSGPIPFRGRDAGSIEAARTGATLDDLERAFDAVKYGACSERPLLEIRVPSVADPSLAPPGRHVASILVHFAPIDLDGGWTAAAKEELLARALAELERHVPGARDLVLGHELLTPHDLAAEYGLSGGHLHHGEHAPDQLLMLRPFAACGGYHTPLRGLLLAGSGSHPGGGLTGVPGLLAARTAARPSLGNR